MLSSISGFASVEGWRGLQHRLIGGGKSHSCCRLVRLPREGGIVPVSLLDDRSLRGPAVQPRRAQPNCSGRPAAWHEPQPPGQADLLGF